MLIFNRVFCVPKVITLKKLNFSIYKNMAKSKFEYVREFEAQEKCLPNCYIVVRIDGKGFHKFTEAHNFEKPNDRSGLMLMTRAAASVMEEFTDIICAFGQSDEYSFIFSKNTNVYNRRSDKIMTVVTSIFSSSYVFHWSKFLQDKKLKYPPGFDARIILYPSEKNLRDYLSWRQADVHINNLYNTAFWGLVLKCGYSKQEAEKELSGTVSSQKHEIMFSKCKINYNNEVELFKKGTVLIKQYITSKESDSILHSLHVPLNCDIIKDDFWNEYPHLLNPDLNVPVCNEIDKPCDVIFIKLKSINFNDKKSKKKKK